MSSFSIVDLMQKDVFLHAEQFVLDWTREQFNYDLILETFEEKFYFNLQDNKSVENFLLVFSYICNSDKILIGYDIKNIISFLTAKTGIEIEINKNIYDISIIQSYFSLPKEKPKSLKEAILVLKKLKDFPNWNLFQNFYFDIFNPLIKTVVPKLETNFLVEKEKKILVSSFYEIEGQLNGRMKCSSSLRNCFLPHNLNEVSKKNLRPNNPDDIFVYFDYKHMEVSVLQWLSQDKKLKEILESGKDFYESVWEILVREKPNESQRKICKNIFLPVIFGQGSYSLSKKLGLEEKITKMLIHKLKSSFKDSFDWVDNQAKNIKNDNAFDVFGRSRKFDQSDAYKIKNFCIQSPASMICLKKLIVLYDSIKEYAKLCFHVHDGYCLLCTRNNLHKVVNVSFYALEKEEDLFPNLNLSVVCKFGNYLNNLEDYKYERNSKFISNNRG